MAFNVIYSYQAENNLYEIINDLKSFTPEQLCNISKVIKDIKNKTS
jgi:hypothetical protein